RHLDFRCAVGVDAGAGLVRITTAVRLHGWRGHVYFTPVRLVHPAVVDAMARRASRQPARRPRSPAVPERLLTCQGVAEGEVGLVRDDRSERELVTGAREPDLALGKAAAGLSDKVLDAEVAEAFHRL